MGVLRRSVGTTVAPPGVHRPERHSSGWVRLDGVFLALYGWDDLATDAELPTVPQVPGFRGITLAHNEPSVADVDRAYQRFLAAGATVVKRPAATDWGGHSGYVADPDGHLWELAYVPFADWT